MQGGGHLRPAPKPEAGQGMVQALMRLNEEIPFRGVGERRAFAHLEEANRADDLELGRRGEGIPLVRRAAGRRDVTEGDGGDVRVHRADRGLERPREVDTVGLDAVADERGHGDTAVLDLGVAEPADGLRGGVVADNVERVCDEEGATVN